MTTVRELIHELTRDHIDLDAEVQVAGEEYDLTTNFTVTAIAGVVRIEAT